jgi:hypothetical protein
LFLDDELNGVDHRQVADHLETCADCRSEALSIEKSWKLLGVLETIEPDPNYRIRFWQSVDARSTWHSRILQSVQAIFIQQRWIPVTAAAAMVLLVSVISIMLYSQKPGIPADLAALNNTELEMIADIELAENYEIIEDIDFFTDFDIIEEMNGSITS